MKYLFKYLLIILMTTSCQSQTITLTNTLWKLSVDSTISDSIKFEDNLHGVYYDSERDLYNRFDYEYIRDTLYLNIFGLISEVRSANGEEVKEKWELVYNNGKFKPSYISYKRDNKFIEVSNDIYQSINQFERVK